MPTIIATALISFVIGLWIGTFRTTRQYNKKMTLLMDILSEDSKSKLRRRLSENPELLDELKDRMQNDEIV